VISFLCFWQVVKLGILYPHLLWNFILAAYLVSKTAVFAVSSVTSQMLGVISLLSSSIFYLCLCQATYRLVILTVSSSSMFSYKHTPLCWFSVCFLPQAKVVQYWLRTLAIVCGGHSYKCDVQYCGREALQ